MSAIRKSKARSGTSKAAAGADVAGWIRERIRRGRFVPGQRLVEADIVAQLGASRSKIREALKRLEAEGLVTIEEFRGASVKRVGPAELRAIYQTRMVLEGLAAAEFAAADVPKLKQRLRALQRQMDRWKQDGGHERFAALNLEWHELIVEGSGNPYIVQFLPRLTVPIYRLLFASFYSDQRIDEANADHRKITSAIVAGRVEEAESAMRRHIAGGLAGVAEINSQFVD
jgi:DNA-binding GntR family transcriptional regulator